MHDGRVRPVLELQAVLLQAPAEVDVTARPNALREAAELLPRAAPDEQVRGHGVGPVRVGEGQRRREQSGRAVALHEAPAVVREDPAGHGARPGGRQRGEVGVEDPRRRPAVGVQEQKPRRPRGERPDVAGVVRRRAPRQLAPPARPAAPAASGAASCRPRPARPRRPRRTRLKRIHQQLALLRVAREGDDDRHGRALLAGRRGHATPPGGREDQGKPAAAARERRTAREAREPRAVGEVEPGRPAQRPRAPSK